VSTAACVAYGFAAGGFEACGVSRERMSFAVTVGALVTLLLAVRYRDGRRGRSVVVGCLATLFVWLPVLAIGASDSVGAVLLPSLERPFDRDLGPWIFTPTLMALIATPVLLATLGRHVRTDLLLRGSAFAALLVVGLGVGLTFLHLADPDPVAYIPSLAVIGDVSPGQTLALGDGTSLDYRLDRDGGGERPSVCHLESLEAPEGWPFASLCCRLRVRRDAKAGLWVIVRADRSNNDAYGAWVLKSGEKRLRTHLDAADVHGAIAPPLAWTLGGYLGLAVGLFFYLSARRREKECPSPATCREGTLGADGWVTFPNAPPIQLPRTYLPELVEGPVTVDLRDIASVSYRSSAGGTVVRWYAGTFADVEWTTRSRAPGLYALALASSLLCAAPLLSWWLSWPRQIW